jgi:hypothetical protein
MMAYGEITDTAPPILNLSTRWGPVVKFRCHPLYPKERVHGTHCNRVCVGPWVGLGVVYRSVHENRKHNQWVNCMPTHIFVDMAMLSARI